MLSGKNLLIRVDADAKIGYGPFYAISYLSSSLEKVGRGGFLFS